MIRLVDTPSPRRVSALSNPRAYGIVDYVVTYPDDDGIVQEIVPVDSVTTIAVATERDVVEFTMAYRPSALLKYYLAPGDTATFTFKDSVPSLEVSTSSHRPIIPNLDAQLIAQLQKGAPRKRDMLRRPIDYMAYDFALGNPAEHERLLHAFIVKLKNESLTEARTELATLARLKEKDSISDAEFKLRHDQLTDFIKPLPGRDSSLAFTHVYHQDVAREAASLWYADPTETNAKKAARLITQVAEDSTLSSDRRRQLQRALVNLALSTQSLTEYVDPVALLTGSNDTAFITYLQQAQPSSSDVLQNGELWVVSTTGDSLAFVDVLSKYRGRYLYVDLWASWCAPCRAVMPASEALREEFRDQAVAFMYLAIRDTPRKWELAVRQEGLTDHDGNYLALNADTAPYLKELGVRSIPRYLLYGPNGQLVHRNADPPQLIGPYLTELLQQGALAPK